MTAAHALPASDLIVEVFELPDETPVVLLTVNAQTPDGGALFTGFVLDLNLETLAALTRGACRVSGLLAALYESTVEER